MTGTVGGCIEWIRAEIDPSAEIDGEVATSGGADSEIHLLRLRGVALPDAWSKPLVLRAKSSPERLDEAHRDAAVQEWASRCGYPTPAMLAVIAPGDFVDVPVQIMHRAAGRPLVDELRQRPWTASQRARR